MFTVCITRHLKWRVFGELEKLSNALGGNLLTFNDRDSLRVAFVYFLGHCSSRAAGSATEVPREDEKTENQMERGVARN